MRSSPPTLQPTATQVRWYVAAMGSLALSALGFVAFVAAADPYRRTPSPPGMVLRVAFGEVEDPLHRVLVVPAPEGRSAFRILNPYAAGGEPLLLEVEYPSGESRPITVDPLPDLPATAPFLDLDGDGVADRISLGDGPDADLVQVRSGAGGAVLFEDRDPFEHATRDRAFSLGDLDRDGYGELALVHPRENRNDYDVRPADWLGVSSWVTVISGARLPR